MLLGRYKGGAARAIADLRGPHSLNFVNQSFSQVAIGYSLDYPWG